MTGVARVAGIRTALKTEHKKRTTPAFRGYNPQPDISRGVKSIDHTASATANYTKSPSKRRIYQSANSLPSTSTSQSSATTVPAYLYDSLGAMNSDIEGFFENSTMDIFDVNESILQDLISIENFSKSLTENNIDNEPQSQNSIQSTVSYSQISVTLSPMVQLQDDNETNSYQITDNSSLLTELTSRNYQTGRRTSTNSKSIYQTNTSVYQRLTSTTSATTTTSQQLDTYDYTEPPCNDIRVSCGFWVKSNWKLCTELRDYMKAQCAKTCGYCEENR